MVGAFGFGPLMTMRARALPLARLLVERGHAVSIVMPPLHTPEAGGKRWTEDGVEMIYSPVPARLSMPNLLVASLRLYRVARATRPDIVHVFKPIGLAGIVASLFRFAHWDRRGIPVVVDEDDWDGIGGFHDPTRKGWLGRLLCWQLIRCLREASAVTVASRALQTIAWSLRSQAHTVHYLPNGAREWPSADGAAVRERYGLGSAPVVLLYTRFFEFDVRRAAEAFGLIRAAVPDARLLIVGRASIPAHQAEFDARIAALGLGDAVVQTGWLEEAELPAFFHAANVALYPMNDTLINRTKCPVKLVDLVSTGVPVVAEAVGEVAEYIRHGSTGMLVPTGDTSALAEAAVLLLRDPALSGRISRQGAQDTRARYGWQARAAELEKIYLALVDRAPASAERPHTL
ncbi:MAG: glycosyltransferase family 4 protein [Chloroflexi bacterium]|nr:glycosyltransferase family 4 protein [Chloroflexota bacterium]